MVDQIHFNVEVPSIGQTVQYTVPINLTIKDCIQLMVNLIEKEYVGVHFDKQPILVDVASGAQINESFSIEELPLLEGSKLLLI